jgi:predicted metal-dependent hydrolase
MNVAEHSEVQFGRTLIDYGIRRSSRRKTVAVTVHPTGVVILTAPTGASVTRLDTVVKNKARWIAGRLRLVRPLAGPVPAKEFLTGESFRYLGRQYRLRVLTGKVEGVRLDAGRLLVETEVGLGAEARAVRVRALLVGWYRSRAEERLSSRAAYWAERIGVPVPRVLVREQELRWGSCSASGVVRFNWRVVQAPSRLVDYVVAHEVLHLRHPDHTKAFWAALGSVLPAAEARRASLREFGRRADW